MQLRKYLRFSLRTLLILMTLAAVGLGLVSHRLQRKRDERQTLEYLTKRGVRLILDFQSTDATGAVVGTPRAPAWLVNLLGEDYFGEVVLVDLSRCEMNQEVAEQVARFEHTEELLATHCKMPAEVLKICTSRMSKLASVDLSYTKITGSDVAWLATFASLEQINLRGNWLSDADIEVLAACSQLESLDLGENQIDGSCLLALGACQRLSKLQLSETQLSAKSLEALSQFPQLSELGLGPIDTGVVELHELKSLRLLHLNAAIKELRLSALPALVEIKELQQVGRRIELSHLNSLQALDNVGNSGTLVLDSLPQLKKLVWHFHSSVDLHASRIRNCPALADAEIETELYDSVPNPGFEEPFAAPLWRDLAATPAKVWIDVLSAKVDDNSIDVLLAADFKLARIDLAYSRVTDAGVERLLILPTLERINLRGTAVTDRIIPMLEQHPKLDRYNVDETNVTMTHGPPPVSVQRR